MRDLVVAAARSWAGTKYHHMAKLKGVGVDCGQLVIAAFEEAGAIEPFDPGFYTCDWHLHRDEDRYIAAVERHLVRGDDLDDTVDQRVKDGFVGKPGDVLIFKVGRTHSHGGVITKWPFFIHSSLPAGIVEEIDVRNSYVSHRPCRLYTFGGYEA